MNEWESVTVDLVNGAVMVFYDLFRVPFVMLGRIFS